MAVAVAMQWAVAVAVAMQVAMQSNVVVAMQVAIAFLRRRTVLVVPRTTTNATRLF